MSKNGHLPTRPYDDATDRDAVVGLVRELQWFERQINKMTKAPEDVGAWYVDYMLSQIKRGQGRIFIAETERVVSGYALVRLMRSTDDSVVEEYYEYACIVDLCVTEKKRGEGLGKALIDACETYTRENDLDVLRIGVLAGNILAEALYDRLGFKPVSMQMEKVLRR